MWVSDPSPLLSPGEISGVCVQGKKDADILEGVQWSAMKRLEHLTYTERLKKLFSLKQRRFRGISPMCTNTWKDGVRSQTSECCALKGQETNQKMGYLIQRWEKNGFYFECGQTWEPIAQKGCGCLHPWRYTKPDQTQPRATCSCSSVPFMSKDMEIPWSNPNWAFAVY